MIVKKREKKTCGTFEKEQSIFQQDFKHYFSLDRESIHLDVIYIFFSATQTR